jgi:hypothetical protein
LVPAVSGPSTLGRVSGSRGTESTRAGSAVGRLSNPTPPTETGSAADRTAPGSRDRSVLKSCRNPTGRERGGLLNVGDIRFAPLPDPSGATPPAGFAVCGEWDCREARAPGTPIRRRVRTLDVGFTTGRPVDVGRPGATSSRVYGSQLRSYPGGYAGHRLGPSTVWAGAAGRHRRTGGNRSVHSPSEDAGIVFQICPTISIDISVDVAPKPR